MDISSGGGKSPGLVTIHFSVSDDSRTEISRFATYIRETIDPATVLNFKVGSAQGVKQQTSALGNLTKQAKDYVHTSKVSEKEIVAAREKSNKLLFSISNAYKSHATLLSRNKNLAMQYADVVRRLQNPTPDMLSRSGMVTTQRQVDALMASTRALEKQSHTIGRFIKESVVSRLRYYVGTYALSGVYRSLKYVLSTIKDINKAMTQLRIVTQQSEDAYERFGETAVAAAKATGRSIVDIIESSVTWARLGYSLTDSAELSRVTGVFSNVANVSIDEATTAMTSILKAYNYDADDAMRIADILTEIGQKYAISASELGVALEKGGAALATAGNTLEESAALMAAGNAAVQNAESVGTAMKTTTLRLAGSKAELEAMGEEVDELASSTSKMRKEILALSGVDIMKDADTYKSTYQILKEIASVWDRIDNVSQMTLLEDLAGKRNASVIASVINNIKDLEGAYSDATNAAGTAERANDVYMDSITGRTGELKATAQELSTNFGNSDVIKGFISFGTAILNVINFLQKLGAFIPLLALIVGNIILIRKNLADIAVEHATINQLAAVGDLSNETMQRYAMILGGVNEKLRERIINELNLTNIQKEQLAATIATGRAVTAKDAVDAIVDSGAASTRKEARGLLGWRGRNYVRDETMLDDAQRKAVANTIRANAELTASNEELANSFDGMGKKAQTAGKGMKQSIGSALTSTFSKVMLVITVVTTLVNVIKSLVKTQDDYIKQADEEIERLKTTQSSLDDNVKKYDELIARRRELERLGNAATLTEIQEKDAIDAKIASLDRENAILRENLELQTAGAKQAIVDAYGGVDFEKGLAKASTPGYRHDGRFSYFATSSADLESAFNTLDNRYQVTGRTVGRTLDIGEAKQYLDQLNQWAAGKDLSDKELKALDEARDILTRWRVGSSEFNDVDYISWILGDTPSQLSDTERTQALIDAGDYLTKLETQLKEAGAVWQKNGGDQELNAIIEKVTLARDAWMVATNEEGAYQRTFEDLIKFGKINADDMRAFIANIAKDGWVDSQEGRDAIEDYTLLFATLGIDLENASDITRLFNAYLQKTGGFASGAAEGLKDEADAIRSVKDAIKALQDPVAALQKAEKEMADTGYLSFETYQKLLDLGLDKYIIKVADGYKLANNATKTYIEKRREQIKTDRDAAAAALKVALAVGAEVAAVQAATTTGFGARKAGGTSGFIGNLTGKEWDANATSSGIEQAKKTLSQWQSLLDEYNRIAATLDRDGAGGGSSSSSNDDPFLKQWEDVNAAMKHEVEMGKRTQASYMEWLRTTTTRGVAGSYLNANEETYKKYYEKIRSVQEEVRKYDLEQLDKQKDAFESLIDFRIKQLEEETKKQKEELDKRKENLEDFYDKQIELLEEQFDEEDYLEEQAEKRKELADMRRQMDMLERDDSAWAKKRLAELKDEYHDAEEDYRKWERDHARDAVKKTLEDERDAAIKEIEDTMEALDKQAEDEAALRKQAITDILSGNKSIMAAMEEFSIKQGTWLEDNIVEKWELAYAAVQKYGRGVGAIAALDSLFGADRNTNETYRFLREILSGDYQKHAAGTPNAHGGWAVTQENGPEAILRRAGGLFTLLNPGDKVLNAGATNFLYAFANNPGAILASSMSSLLSRNALTPAFAGMSNNSTTNIDMGDVIIQGNADEKTVSEFRREKRKLVNDLLQEFKKLR